jgi:hypothetical protein
MAEPKATVPVSRAEFYSTVALLFLFIFFATGINSDTVLGEIGSWILRIVMVGSSLAYSIMAIWQRRRHTNAKRGDIPDEAADRP